LRKASATNDRGDAGALAERGELGPGHLRVDLARAGLRGEPAVVADHHVLAPDEVGVIDQVRREPAFALLAVVDDVQAGVELPRDAFVHCRCYPGLELVLVIGLVAFFGPHQLDQIVVARDAARVGVNILVVLRFIATPPTRGQLRLSPHS
jgi:hypothetical protein